MKKNTKITIYLSERSNNFLFLINNNSHENIEFRKINYDLNIFEKFKLFFYLLFNKISQIFILTPKKFYFYLPFFFRSFSIISPK